MIKSQICTKKSLRWKSFEIYWGKESKVCYFSLEFSREENTTALCQVCNRRVPVSHSSLLFCSSVLFIGKNNTIYYFCFRSSWYICSSSLGKCRGEFTSLIWKTEKKQTRTFSWVFLTSLWFYTWKLSSFLPVLYSQHPIGWLAQEIMSPFCCFIISRTWGQIRLNLSFIHHL